MFFDEAHIAPVAEAKASATPELCMPPPAPSVLPRSGGETCQVRGRRSDLVMTAWLQSAPADAPAVMSTPRLITAQQASLLLNVPATWLLAEARDNRIPHVRLGRYVRFEPNELVTWWRGRARGPRSTSTRTIGA